MKTFTGITSFLVFALLVFAFQNCSKGNSIGSAVNQTLVASTSSVPPEDQAPSDGPPSTGGDGGGGGGGGETGGAGAGADPPACVTVKPAEISSPVADNVVYEIKMWSRDHTNTIFLPSNSMYLEDLSVWYLTFSTTPASQYGINPIAVDFYHPMNSAYFLRPTGSLSDEFLFVRTTYYVSDDAIKLKETKDLQLCLEDPDAPPPTEN